MRPLARLVPLAFVVALAGCAGLIKGVTNTNPYATPRSSASYTIEPGSGGPVMAPKIARMLDHQMQKLGFRRADASGDLKVSFAFDVVPVGTISRAHTFIYPTSGSTVATANTTISTMRIFEKSIAVRLVETRTNEILWEGLTTEKGWCDQILVTAPAILSLLFKDFPREQTNARQVQNINAPAANEFKALFPPDTDWGCR